MSLIKSLFGLESASELTLTSERGWDRTGFYGAPTSSGECVSPESALAISTYFACVRNLGEDPAKAPLKMYKRVEGGKQEAKDHPLYTLLHDEANPEMSMHTLRETMGHWMPSWGNAYAEIVVDVGGMPRQLWPIHPSTVTPKRAETGMLYYEVTDKGGRKKIIPASRMLHVHNIGPDGITGYSVASLAAETLGVAKAAQTFAGSFFGNGATPAGILSTQQALKPEVAAHMKEVWDSVHRGAKNANRTALLHGGVEYKPIGMPLRDAQFLESRQFQKEEIAQWFRMPLSKLQDNKRAQGWSTLDAQNTDYVVDTLLPWVLRWESEIKRKLIPIEEREIFFAEHDLDGLLRGDAEGRMRVYQARMLMGTITQNEIRSKENENPLPGDAANKTYMPSNMVSLDKLDEVATQPTAGGFGGAAKKPDTKPAPAQDNAPESQEHMRVLFDDAAERVIKWEVNRTKAAMSKYKDAPSFKAWLDGFVPEQREYWIAAFMPACKAMRYDRPLAGLDDAVDKSAAHTLSAFIEGRGPAYLDARLAMISTVASTTFNSIVGDKTLRAAVDKKVLSDLEPKAAPVQVHVNVRGEQALTKHYDIVRDPKTKVITSIKATEETAANGPKSQVK